MNREIIVDDFGRKQTKVSYFMHPPIHTYIIHTYMHSVHIYREHMGEGGLGEDVK